MMLNKQEGQIPPTQPASVQEDDRPLSRAAINAPISTFLALEQKRIRSEIEQARKEAQENGPDQEVRVKRSRERHARRHKRP